MPLIAQTIHKAGGNSKAKWYACHTRSRSTGKAGSVSHSSRLPLESRGLYDAFARQGFLHHPVDNYPGKEGHASDDPDGP